MRAAVATGYVHSGQEEAAAKTRWEEAADWWQFAKAIIAVRRKQEKYVS